MMVSIKTHFEHLTKQKVGGVNLSKLKKIKQDLQFIQQGYDLDGYISTNTADDLIRHSKHLIHKVNQQQREIEKLKEDNERLLNLKAILEEANHGMAGRVEEQQEEIEQLKEALEYISQ